MKIGFAGLGAMGGPMADHLLDAGHTLYVLTRRRESADAAIAKGAIWAETPKTWRLIRNSFVLFFLALPRSRRSWPAKTACAPASKPERPDIDLSTNSPALVRELSADLAKIGVSMLDAPVSGGPKGAASRKLAIWVSGEKATFDTCKPILDLLGDQVRYLGDSGNASVAKLVHNCANYGIQMVLAETFTFGVKAGVDPVALWGAIRQGSLGRQRAVDRMADQFLPHEFDNPAFALELAHKDVSLATALGRETGVPMRFANMTLAEMTEALNKGWGKRDSRSAMLIQEERAGLDIRVPRDVLQDILKNEPL